MATSVESTTPSTTMVTRIRRVFARSQTSADVPRLDCTADVQIPEERVADALSALTTEIPGLRRYRAGSPSPARARSNLVAALCAARQEAKRSPHSVGVDVLEAHGTEDHLSRVFAALAPYVREGSFVQVDCDGSRNYWTFEGGAIVRHSGEHPVIGELAMGRSVTAEFGAA